MKIYILIISLFSTVAFGKTTTILNKKKATTENAIKVIQENGKTIYQYCERDELTGAKDDVFLVKYNCEAIGKIDGYTKLDLKQIDKQLKKQHRNEYIMDAAAVATFLLSYKIAAKRFAARQTYRWDNGQFTSMFYSATSRTYLYENIALNNRSKLINHGMLLALALGVKSIFIDDTSDIQDQLEIINEAAGEDSDSMMLIKGFDAEEAADHLSRVLK